MIGSPFHLRQAGRVIHQGGVIAYPTEAVFGLGCDPLNPAAVHRLLDLKKRPLHKGVILIGATFEQVRPYMGPLDDSQLKKMKESWPGPNTWVVPAAPGLPHWLTGGRTTIALRVTDHPVAARLCLAAGTALVSTSANISDQPPARSALQVRRQFGNGLDMIVNGPLGSEARPTTIRNLLDGAVLRN